MTATVFPVHRPHSRPDIAARLLLVAGVIALVVAVVLTTVTTDRPTPAEARVALADVSGILTAQHAQGRPWPTDLVVAGSSVLDADTGRRLATLPSGLSLTYERSLDGTRIVLTVRAGSSAATFDSAPRG